MFDALSEISLFCRGCLQASEPGCTMSEASVIISSYNRASQLFWNLSSLRKFSADVEIIVLNDGMEDDDTENIALKFCAKYVFTGQRNKSLPVWRVPGFPNNIGARLSSGELLIFCCAEIFHPFPSIALIAEEFSKNPLQLIGPKKILNDWDGRFFDELNSYGCFGDATYRRMLDAPPGGFSPNPFVPFCMGMPRRVFFEIGGYDEDFTGIGDDDNDLVERMVAAGCSYKFLDFEVVHLYHGPKKSDAEFFSDPRFVYNRKLWHDRRGRIIRNEGKEWGVL